MANPSELERIKLDAQEAIQPRAGICPTCGSSIDKMIALFEEYHESLGVGSRDELKRQCEFEEKFGGLICEARGHEFGPDQCGKPAHDYCYRCNVMASELGFVRGEKGEYVQSMEFQASNNGPAFGSGCTFNRGGPV